MCTCTKEKEIDDMQKDIQKIQESIEGNGKLGMKAELIMIKDEQKSMNGLLSTLNASLAGVMKFMVETQTESRIKEKIKLRTTNVVNIIITTILGAAAVVVALIVKG